ncbi:hypothetical protein LR48_Vigan05g087800 [Vigna angularis]|uniref:Uncharacterized protein n=1 Tax=Phaseolus angularis TaxID=3914 RepID=A0A0L9UL36_PHAAN|nr:hypothetical protein LR48_Vigan05g087800 [Vigna angularis]
MTGQGSERPDKGKGVARPKKRQRQAPKFIPSRVASQAITRSIKQQFLSPWPTWGAIPDDDTKPFWERFQMKMQWKPKHETQIHRNFHMKASHWLSEMFRDARNGGQRPYWLGEQIWNSLLAHWKPHAGTGATMNSISLRPSHDPPRHRMPLSSPHQSNSH